MTPSSSITPECSSTTLPIPTAEFAKSRNCSECKPDLLPPYLNNTEPLEPDDQALQLALITMEVASQREKLMALSRMFEEMARLVKPDSFLGAAL